MTLTKAIEILKDLKEGLDLPLMTDCEEAIKLGIEALKRTQEYRTYEILDANELLPGETDD